MRNDPDPLRFANRITVWFATVVDEPGEAPINAAVQIMRRVQAKYAVVVFLATAKRFLLAYPLSHILDHSSACWDRMLRQRTGSVNGRCAKNQMFGFHANPQTRTCAETIRFQ